MLTVATRAVLLAAQSHPLAMSPTLMDYLLRGEVIGRMAEKGLAGSPHFGALADAPEGAVAEAIATCLEQKWLTRAAGFYPALRLTVAGDVRLLAEDEERVVHCASDDSYHLYHTWREGIDTRVREIIAAAPACLLGGEV